MLRVVLILDHASRGFVQPLASLLNHQQDDFKIEICTKVPAVSRLQASDAHVDIDEGMRDVAACKAALGLRDEDLLIRFCGAVLSARSHGLTNLFIAGSALSEHPPRVAIISTRFIKNQILPADPSYGRQRHALYHLLVCCLLGAFLDMAAHRDRGCLLDFNSFTPDILRKLEIGYSFCDNCLRHVECHPLGNSISIICGILKASGDRPMAHDTLRHGDPTTSEKAALIDFAILTAIEVERRAVCAAFGLGNDDRVKKGTRVYWKGRLPLSNGQFYELVVAQCSDVANVDAALATSDLLHHWLPGAAILVGIAACTKSSEIRLGDVVAGSDVYYFERGKVTPTGVKIEPKMIPADATLWANITTASDWKPTLAIHRPDGTQEPPKLHFGVIASGEKVLAEEVTRDEIAKGQRKIVAIEMEGYGFSKAVWQSFDRVRHLLIRGICDDGTSKKNDDWHAYAAASAAGLAKHFLMDRPLEPRNQIR
jgi:nucleoside phosphorylase